MFEVERKPLERISDMKGSKIVPGIVQDFAMAIGFVGSACSIDLHSIPLP